jgi:hypothetical protein
VYDPDRSDLPPSKAEILETVWRNPPATTIPEIGDVVWYRHEEWGDLTEALVEAVQDPDADRTDPNVWYRDHATGAAVRMHDRPWLALTLSTAYGRVSCREARARGSAGWLPHDWDPPVADPQVIAAYR